MKIERLIVAITLLLIGSSSLFADVEIVLNAFNLPKTNDKASPIEGETLGVVVAQELDDDATKIVHTQKFTG
jgi:hypothetical protein